jgi:hypothetical protein
VTARPPPSKRRPNVIVLPIESSGRLSAGGGRRNCDRHRIRAARKTVQGALTVIRCARRAFHRTMNDLDFDWAFTHVALFEARPPRRADLHGVAGVPLGA